MASVKKRLTYYLTKAYSSRIERGDDSPKLNQVIFIGILNFKLFENNKHHLTRHQLLDTVTHCQEFEELEFVFIELPKFKKKEAELTSFLDKWIYFIKHAPDLDVIPEHVQEPELKAAYEVADQFGWSEEDLESYDNRGILMQDERGALEYAQKVGCNRASNKGRNAKPCLQPVKC